MYILFYALSLILGIGFVILAIVNVIAASLYGPLSYYLEALLIVLAILSFYFSVHIKRRQGSFLLVYIIILIVATASYLIAIAN